ncbi:MAG: glycosyltransferase family 2 protein [Marinilabiliaceae bacterium]|nr:glycosyltransferase family 2 protein [Marinilabiliaceae bacterium]
MPLPAVSVVMPVYNGAEFLEESIQSILEQTFDDFELIIINDGSTDHSASVINSFKDKRIVTRHYKINQGNYKTRNIGMSMAKGKYICVMDSDDIAYPHRIQTQFDFMEKENSVGVCGSDIEMFGRINMIFKRIKSLV